LKSFEEICRKNTQKKYVNLLFMERIFSCSYSAAGGSLGKKLISITGIKGAALYERAAPIFISL
jgi:hypothetical protein